MKVDKPEDGKDGERERNRAVRYVREFVATPPPTKVPLNELVAKGHTVVDRVQLLVRRIARRFGRR